MTSEYLLMNQTAPMLRFSCERNALISKLALNGMYFRQQLNAHKFSLKAVDKAPFFAVFSEEKPGAFRAAFRPVYNRIQYNSSLGAD
jgi:hypothetical protein